MVTILLKIVQLPAATPDALAERMAGMHTTAIATVVRIQISRQPAQANLPMQGIVHSSALALCTPDNS